MGRLRVFWVLMALWVLVGSLLLALLPKGEGVLLLNRTLAPTADGFFLVMTALGDGLALALLGVAALLLWYRAAVWTALAAIIQTLLVQGSKRNLFPGLPRPTRYFEEQHGPEFLQQLTPSPLGYVPVLDTFPSGHTATGFTLALLVALWLSYSPQGQRAAKHWQGVLFGLALLVGCSRMYLQVHFLADVYVGSLVGLFSVAVSWWLCERFLPQERYAGLSGGMLQRQAH